MMLGIFLFFASFKSYDYLSEENACFIHSQSLTACRKKTKQVIKIPRHHFLEKGVTKTNILSTFSHSESDWKQT